MSRRYTKNRNRMQIEPQKRLDQGYFCSESCQSLFFVNGSSNMNGSWNHWITCKFNKVLDMLVG